MALTGDERAPHRQREHAPAGPPGRSQAGRAATSGAWRSGSGARCAATGGRGSGSRSSHRDRRLDAAASTSSTAAAPSPRAPSRAAARAYLKGIGFTDEDLRQPHHRRRQHLDRDDAVQLPPARAWPPRSRKASAPPAARRWSSTPIAISDGITMGTRGHEDLARQPRGHRRLDRAGGARPPASTPSSRWAAATRPSPARSWRWPASTCPAVMLYGGSIAPGRFEGHDVTIQDVFEAVGAHAARQDDRRRSSRELEDVACPAAGACGGQFTANTMATGLGVPGHLARWARDGPGRGRARRTRRRSRPGELVDGRAPARPAPERDPHPRRLRERHRRGGRHRRLDQRACCTCWPSPTRPASRSTIDDFDASAERTPLHRATSSRAAATSPSTCTTPAASRWWPSACCEAGLLHGEAMTVTGRTLAEDAPSAPSRRRARRSCGPLDDPVEADRRARHPARQPRARGLRRQGRRPRAPLRTRGPARVFDSEEAAMAAVQARQIVAGRRGRHPLRGPAPAGRACARCSA